MDCEKVDQYTGIAVEGPCGRGLDQGISQSTGNPFNQSIEADKGGASEGLPAQFPLTRIQIFF